ncbi:MAG TPA: hypothetical protein VFM02_00605 [Candidatus Paceibacterota bacterium]|nr:hypothetical protein [Candidatus Paceibacterota bacterium]
MMNFQEFQDFFGILLPWYEKNKRKFPWRKNQISAYEVWVSEIMLQQTQVSRGEKYYKNFLKKFPSIRALSACSWEEFLPYYDGLGYYARGRNMLKTAKTICEEYGGKFPTKKSELLKLPGVGEYTASAILAFARDEKVFAWDTNVVRIFQRALKKSELSKKDRQHLESFLHQSSLSGKAVNSALMDFGSLVCVSRPNRKLHECPFEEKCFCFEGILEKVPASRGKKEVEKFSSAETSAMVFLHENHRKYFSDKKKTFVPFILSPGISSREKIKAHFLQTYGLNISVRPPHAKKLIQKKPFVFVNAQILSGSHSFFVHPKSPVEEFLKNLQP